MLIRLSSDLVRRRMVAGASTLTMQLAREPLCRRSRIHARRQEPRAQDQGDPRRDPDRKALHEARDPHVLLQSDDLRPRHVRRRGRGAAVFRQARERRDARRSGDDRRHHPDAGAAEPVRQSRRRQVPARLHAAADGRQRLHHAGAGRRVQEEADRHARPAAAGAIGGARSSPRKSASTSSRNTARRRCTKAACPCRRASTSGCSARPIARSIAACAWSTSAAAIAATSRTSSRRGTTSRRTDTSDGRSRSRQDDIVPAVVMNVSPASATSPDRPADRRASRRGHRVGEARTARAVQGRRPDRRARDAGGCSRRKSRRSRSSSRRSSKARSWPSTTARARFARWSAGSASIAASSIARRRRTARSARCSSRSSTPRRSIAGYTPTSVIVDEPVSYDPGPGQPPYQPKNYDGKYEGGVTLRHALEDSRNVPAVKMMEALTPQQVISYARRFGLEVEARAVSLAGAGRRRSDARST